MAFEIINRQLIITYYQSIKLFNYNMTNLIEIEVLLLFEQQKIIYIKLMLINKKFWQLFCSFISILLSDSLAKEDLEDSPRRALKEK